VKNLPCFYKFFQLYLLNGDIQKRYFNSKRKRIIAICQFSFVTEKSLLFPVLDPYFPNSAGTGSQFSIFRFTTLVYKNILDWATVLIENHTATYSYFVLAASVHCPTCFFLICHIIYLATFFE